VTDFSDRATEREEQVRADALADQERRSGLVGKTIADSAHFCGLCEDPIPDDRRRALPAARTGSSAAVAGSIPASISVASTI